MLLLRRPPSKQEDQRGSASEHLRTLRSTIGNGGGFDDAATAAPLSGAAAAPGTGICSAGSSYAQRAIRCGELRFGDHTRREDSPRPYGGPVLRAASAGFGSPARLNHFSPGIQRFPPELLQLPD